MTSVNGFTGAVQVTGSGAIVQTVSGTTTTFGARLSTSSVTGVASFRNTHFTVDTTGHVQLATAYQVTGQTVVSGGPSLLVSTSGNTVTVDNRVASTSVTGVAAFNATRFTVSAAGAVDLASAFQVTGDTVQAGSFINIGAGKTINNIGVQTLNGLTGAVVSIATTGSNVFTGLNSFNAGLSAIGATFSGDIAVQGGDITTSSATATVFNTTATTLSIGSAATSWTVGATSGYAYIRNPHVVLGNLDNTTASTTISTAAYLGTNDLYISPVGNLYITPTAFALGEGTLTTLVVTNNTDAAGQVQVGGGDLYLGVKSTDGFSNTPVNIIFEGSTDNANDTTLTVVNPTATRTITLPDASGIVALTNTTVASINGLTGAITLTAGSNITLTPVGNIITIASSGGGGGSSPIASASVTGVASFGNAFTVSAAGAVGLTSNYVRSVNGLTGAVVSIATTGSNVFTGLNTFNAGISASNVTTDYLTVPGGSTFGAAVNHTFGLSNRGLQINAGKGTSEILSYGNETLAVSAMGGNGNLELFGGYVTVGDDGNNDGTQIVLADNSGQTITYTAANGHVFNGTGSFSGLLTTSAGISAGGTTAANFNGLVDMNFNTLFEPTLRYYNEVLASPTISANVLTLNLSTAQMFTVSLNANITTFTITNTPATANRSIGFTLIFTADGTARTVTWGSAVKWANNDPPTLTSTNGKKDILSFVSPDGGTNWYGFIGGLNF